MQQYFPMDFKTYATDRNTLGIPRQRAVLMSWLVEFHSKQAHAAAANQQAELEDEERPTSPVIDRKGHAVCPCAKGGFRGRHYVNDDAGWRAHCLTASHKKWRAHERDAVSVGSAPAIAASDMPWMQQQGCERLKLLCQHMNFTSQIGKKLIAFQLKDADIQALRYFTMDRMLSTFGLARAQVLLIRQYLDSEPSETFVLPPLSGDALLPRTNPLSQVLYPPPSQYFQMRAAAASAPSIVPPPAASAPSIVPPPAASANVPLWNADNPQPRKWGKFAKK
jgi:hypothetical protein